LIHGDPLARVDILADPFILRCLVREWEKLPQTKRFMSFSERIRMIRVNRLPILDWRPPVAPVLGKYLWGGPKLADDQVCPVGRRGSRTPFGCSSWKFENHSWPSL